MNPTFDTNKRYWRNFCIIFLLIVTVSSVFIIAKTHHSRKEREKALKLAIEKTDFQSIFAQEPILMGGNTTFSFEKGTLWAKNMDKETDIVYTSFINPHVVMSADTAFFYEYPRKTFYVYNKATFTEREADVPISSIVTSKMGRYAILDDYDCQIAVYENDGTMLFSLASASPIVDIALSEDGRFLFVTQILLNKKNTFLIEGYQTEKGRRLFGKHVTFQNIPSCAPYKNGCLIWDDTNALYIKKRGQWQVLSKTT